MRVIEPAPADARSRTSRKMVSVEEEGRVTTVADALPPADRRSVFANAPMGVALTTPDGVIVDANPALGALVGVPDVGLRARSVLDLVHPDAGGAAREAHATLMAQRDRPMRHETRLVRADGSEVPVQVTASWVDATPQGEAPHLVMIVEDITERKALEAQLVHRSLHDPLTALPNRVLFQDRLWHALNRGKRERTPTCVLIVDLDDFKSINDRFGHGAGDHVLRTVGTRLVAAGREGDWVARLGGDEFTMLLPGSGREHADRVAARIREVVREPIDVGTELLCITPSVGAACFPDEGTTAEALLRSADRAMYRIKHSARVPTELRPAPEHA